MPIRVSSIHAIMAWNQLSLLTRSCKWGGRVRLRTLDDVRRQGEIEGLSFDKSSDEMLVLYNRGARIVQGMPVGFYDGYDREIHEVYSYGAKP